MMSIPIWLFEKQCVYLFPQGTLGSLIPLVNKFKDSVIKHLQTQRGGVTSSAELLHDPRLIHLITKL